MKQKFTLFFALVLLFASCKDNIAELQTTDLEEFASKFVLTATIGNESRTSVTPGGDTYAAGEKSEWVAGDHVHVYFYNGASLAGNLYFRANSNGQTSTFTMLTGIPPTEFYTTVPSLPAFPASYRVVVAYRENNITDFDNQTQAGSTTTHVGKKDPMKAEAPTVSINFMGEADLNVTFDHLASLLRFSVTNATGAEIAIKSIEVKSSDPSNEFYASANYSYTTHNFTPSNLKPSLRLSCSQNIAAGAKAEFYMTTPGNTVAATGANFLITVGYDAASSKVFTVPMSTNDFLKVPFEGGKRYYFDLTID